MNRADEILSMLRSVRHGPGFVTNCFLQDEVVRSLAASGCVEALCFAGVACLLHREETFHRLYFAAPDLDSLRDAVFALPLPPGEVITDIIGNSARITPVAAVLCQAGFSPYKDFQRMVRLAGDLAPRNATAEPNAQFAALDDAARVHELIAASFDPRAEHLPTLIETVEAVARRSVLVARHGSRIAAVLFSIVPA